MPDHIDKSRRKELTAQYKERKTEGGVYSVTNTVTGQKHLFTSTDLHGDENRVQFMKNIKSDTVFMTLRDEVRRYGFDAFQYELMETLERGETQTPREYAEDLAALRELLEQKLSSERQNETPR